MDRTQLRCLKALSAHIEEIRTLLEDSIFATERRAKALSQMVKDYSAHASHDFTTDEIQQMLQQISRATVQIAKEFEEHGISFGKVSRNSP